MAIGVEQIARGTFVPMLQNLSAILGKAMEHADSRKIDRASFAGARLAPDMYTLAQQVQIACRHAREAVAQLTGRPAPAPAEAADSLEGMQTQISETIGELQNVPADAFAQAEDRRIVIPIPNGMQFEMSGFEFLRDWCLAHFYFHVVTAYDILRHKGVEIGKRDYMGSIAVYLRPAPK